MSVCLRTVSNKLIPLNAIVASRQPASKLEKCTSNRSQFLEEFLGVRHLSNGAPRYSIACLSPQNDHQHKIDTTETLIRLKFENYSKLLKKKRQIEATISSLPSSKADNVKLRNIDNFLSRYGTKLDSESRMNCEKDSNVGIWQKYSRDSLLTTNYYTELYSTLDNPSQDTTIYTCERLPVLRSEDVTSSPSATSRYDDGFYFSTLPAGQNEKSGSDSSGKASSEQLQFIYDRLAENLPDIFVRVMDYKIYDQNLKFTNNIRGGITTIGLYHYVKQVAILRTLGHIRFAYVKMTLLNMAVRHEDSAVVVRWRISGISGLRVMLMFWKYKLWKVSETVREAETWYDGVSTFYVGSDGLIKEHIADKMVPDDDNAVDELDKTSVAAKLALLLGLVPRPSIEHLGPALEALTSYMKKTSSSFLTSNVDKCKSL